MYNPSIPFGTPLFLLPNCESRSITAENPDGRRGGGARHVPEPGDAAERLGVGWKARAYINLQAGSVTTIADIEGSGIIQHIWITVAPAMYRDGIIRFYWDEEEEPSVECPLGDFFANGHGLRYDVTSQMVTVGASGGFNCYWQMPFKRRARITIENQRTEEQRGFYYQVDYALMELPDEVAYFHAQWRRSLTTRENPEHVILDGVTGNGQYVGTHVSWVQMSNGWWGEGEVKFFIDGDKEYPTICGTGTEDYAGGAWNFGDRTFSAPWCGYPLRHVVEGEVPRHAFYRWHVPDPIRFNQDLRVTVQALGWYPNKKFQPLTDDIASVAYWYQTEPHGKFPAMPEAEERWSR
jgi:hypothetical protein